MIRINFDTLICMVALAICPAANAMRALGASVKTQAFVLDTLYKGYPELQEREVLVVDDYKHGGFTATKLINQETGDYIPGNIIKVPFNEEQLDLSSVMKHDKATLMYDEAVEILCALKPGMYDIEKLHLIGQISTQKARFYPRILQLLENSGYACRPTTIDFWRGAILHEGSHMLYEDAMHGKTYHRKYAQLQAMHDSSAFEILCASGAILPHFIKAYYAEYRADQECIKRAGSPEILRAMSLDFKHESQAFPAKSTLVEKMVSFFAPHPHKAWRAAYFAKAAQKFEKN